MQRSTKSSVPGSLAKSLAERGMAVADAGNVFGAARILHYGDGFGDHIRCPRSEDMDAQQPVGLRIRDQLDHALGLVEALGPAVGQERELSHFVFPLRLL